MDRRNEILREIRRNEQKKSLEELRNRFIYYLNYYDFEMQIEIKLDDYLPESHLDYNREILSETLENYASNLSIYINGYHCKLFNELSYSNQVWYDISEESEGSNIFIKNDRLIIYQWHFTYSNGVRENSLQSTLMSAYLTMFLCFLPLLYNDMNYNGRICFKLNLHGIEECVFYPPRSSDMRRPKSYNKKPFESIKRILPLDRITKKGEKRIIIRNIFLEILPRYFNYNYYRIPRECNRKLDECNNYEQNL